MNAMRRRIVCLLTLCVVLLPAGAQSRKPWRAATSAEMEAFLPARATVQKERIETELRTATGITDDRGKMIAAVVLITAGYSAEGKYSHYLLTQSAMRIGGQLRLAPGAYVLGWARTPDGLLIHIFDAVSGDERGAVTAHPVAQPLRVESFKIWPPGERKMIQIGRFMVAYDLED